MNIKEIEKTFFFNASEDDAEYFFCPCGNHFSEKKIQVDPKGLMVASEFYSMNVNNKDFENFDVNEFLSNVSLETDVTCVSCGRKASEFNKQGLKHPVNTLFFKNFEFEETTDELLLHKILYKAVYSHPNKLENEELSETNQEIRTVDSNFKIIEERESIFINKETKEIGLKKGEQVVILDLENLFDSIQEFFNSQKESVEVKIEDGLLNIYLFIGRLANLIRDVKNIDVVSGMMEEINGSRGISLNKTIPSLIKIVCMMMAISKHENLATIALVKSGIFLFELLKDCDLPKASVLKELDLTKPIQIFNYLINIEAKKAQDKIDKSDKKKQKFAYRSVKLQDGFEININTNDDIYKSLMIDADSKIKKEADGTMTLKETLIDKKISPFFFKKIKSVSEYKSIIKYCKFVSYNELMNIIMKYDSMFLISLYDFLEYRNDVDNESIYYFFNLYADFFSKKDNDYYGKEFKDYLIYFDDSKRILASLKWNIKRELMTIKKCNELEKYHNWLIKQYNNTVEKKDSKIKYQSFVEKYKALEEYVHEDIEIRLIDTVEGLLFWAKQLNNSAAAYAINVEKGIYLMAMVNYKTFKKDDKIGNLKNFMLGLNVDKRGMLEFDQFKSTNNQLASNKLKLILMDYLREKDISFRELEDLSLIESNTSTKAKQAEFMYNNSMSIEDAEFIIEDIPVEEDIYSAKNPEITQLPKESN